MLLNGGKETVVLIDAQNRAIFSNEKEQTIGTNCMWHWDESQRYYAGGKKPDPQAPWRS